ncbi:DUF177 domain-containing protein [Chloroflexota bacterium]
MLQINVSQLLKEPIGSIRDYRVSEVTDIANGSSLIQGEVRLMRTDHGILVKGTLHTEIELICSRCLSSFSCPLTLDIEEEYFPTTNVVTGTSLPPPDDPERFPIDGNNVLDLTEAVRQYALLIIPMKPLCHEDCAGLCPTCGCNLNQAPCKCHIQPTDPRLSVLSKLF